MSKKQIAAEQCAICFEDLLKQKIGIPECCNHQFCFNCLVTWTKERNTCPNDRQTFQYILKKHSFFHIRSYAKVDISNTEDEILLEVEDLTTYDYEQEKLKYILNWLEAKRQKPRKITFGLKEDRKIVRDVKPLRRLQEIPRRNLIRQSENVIHRHTPTSSNNENNSSVRSVITPTEAARRIAASGIPIQPSPQSKALMSQAQNMAALKRKRERVARLPRKIPVSQLPKIQRRIDAPIRPHSNIKTQGSNPSKTTAFIDKLLNSQEQLCSLKNIQMQGAQVKLS